MVEPPTAPVIAEIASEGLTRAEWNEAGLHPADFSTAMRLRLTPEDWRLYERRRASRRTAGWSTIASAVAGGAALGLVFSLKEWGVSEHPQMETFTVSMVAVGAAAVTGLLLLATLPTPEDFAAERNQSRAGFRF